MGGPEAALYAVPSGGNAASAVMFSGRRMGAPETDRAMEN